MSEPVQMPIQLWRCKRGHEYSASASFDLTFNLDGRAVAKTGALCGVCLADFLSENFATESAGIISPPAAAPVEEPSAPQKKTRKKAQ